MQLDSPSPEAIVSLYRLIAGQASEIDATTRELEGTKAEVERKDIELDQALQDRESASRELETTLENVQNELRQVKQEKEEIVASRSALQAQLSAISNSQSMSSSEVETLKHRVEDTEREKRDLVGLVSRLKEDAVQREGEVQSLRAVVRQARQEQQAVESQLRELRSTETSTKFKLDTLSQQLKLSKDEAERASAELMTKSEEFAKYRRTKHAEFAQLQSAHDSLIQTHAAAESSLKALQSAHTTQTHQLTQALGRVQTLTGRLAEQEATYSSEAAGLKRLVEMMQDREAQAKAIVEDVEKRWADVGDLAERREVVLREEIETQRQRAEEAEKRVQDLKGLLDRLDRGDFPHPGAAAGSAPSTPARGPTTPFRNDTPDFLTHGMMGLSPTVAMASRAQRGGKTFTEIYSDYIKLQEDYARKSIENEEMARSLTEVLAEIEQRAPMLNQQREEYERMQSEATLLASQLAQSLNERDAHAMLAEENGQKLAKSEKESELLKKQLDDLGRQVQVLLKELGRRQDPSIPSDEELEADEATAPAENIEAVITNNLVLFRSIPALQDQNQKLLKVVRELGAKMEAEEQEYRAELQAEQQVALDEAFAAVSKLQEQLENQKKHGETTIQAYMKERDALKSMLARERASARSVNGINGHGEGLNNGTDTEKELAEIQAQFEAYKTEMGVDSGTLREELLNEQNNMQNRELDNLQRRNQELYDQYTRIDIECNRVSEEFQSASGLVEQLRNETANLRAEKKIWESVQSRLVDENKTLAIERSHLSDLMSNVQKMHNDLERSGENDRRRLENQIQMLENQTQDLRTQLTQERDSVRHLSLQKDLDLKELRTRIDKTSEEYARTREALVSAQTSKTHLEAQVEQLNRRLQGNEEKLSVYEHRSSGLAGVTPHTDQDLSREQQLEAEVAELRSTLKVAEVDLATARNHVQQFQDISQANEAALASLNATHDEFKASTEAQIAKHESEYRALQDRFQSVQDEHARLSSKNGELQRVLETERAAWSQDRRTLEDTIVDMTTSEKSTESDRASRESEVREQEERAKVAEERYGREVLAHAEAIKTVENLKQQLSGARTNARDQSAAAETAQAKLGASEASWKQQKDALDKEIADLNARCKDLSAQNNLLHQHLESVSSQAARIRQAADSSATPAAGDVDSTEDVDTKLSELRSVVTYLRKEKEIVDLQLELSKQENARLRTQMEHLNQSLEEARKTLSEERERAVEAAASDAQHAELVERINQLTILRESNATLRADCETQAKRARILDAKLQQLSSELEPTKEQLRMAQAELETRNEQVRRLEEDSHKWQERNAQLLSKYDRIDPAEVQALKEQIESLNAAKAELEAATASNASDTVEKVAYLEDQIRKLKDTGRRNNDVAKTRFSRHAAEKEELEATISQLREELQTVTAEKDALKVQTESPATVTREQELLQQIQTLDQDKAELEKRLLEVQSTTGSENEQILALRQERDALLVEKATWTATASSPEGVQVQWETEKADLIKTRDEATAKAKTTMERAQHAAKAAHDFRAANLKLNAQVQELLAAKASDTENAAAQQKAAIEAAIERVKAEMQAAGNSSTETDSRHAEELRALEERLAKKYQEELKSAVDAAKANVAKGTAGPDQKAAIDAAIAAREQEWKSAHEAEIAAAVESGRREAEAKNKIKDAQLVRTQAKLKVLEGQLEQLKNNGILPDVVSNPPSATTQPSTKLPGAPAALQAKPSAAPTTVKPPIATAKPGAPPPKAPAPAGGPSTLPQKPGVGGAGRGHPAPRGGAPARVAAAAGLVVRRAAEGAEAKSNDTGVSIMGAAGKRAREDGEASGDDALAKRLKPEGAGKPVPIQRNRIPPPS
ncbi:hypothetical protein EW026_g2304 [Hermanssonia centrifuga]|uniref:Uncharacterized protein n=1 Tax=Hermanssonia centrifuga TaxID=98765 RepID=A0A4S4KNP5_9APHY|nr:hypothetical protein EW026_g2304 [Hermanssonia centrifuga]